MDCRITSTRRRRAGFSLVELMVTTGIAGVVLTVVAMLMFYTGRSFAAMTNYVELDAFSRNALDTMSHEIRQTRRLKSWSETSLTFEDYDGKNLSYTYNAQARQLVRVKDGVTDPRPLLTDCNYLKFSIYQRNSISGTYDQYPAATPETCKLVQLRWICSRDLIKARCNTESVQSAKIVIRKQ